jgi:hypothetical protein
MPSQADQDYEGLIATLLVLQPLGTQGMELDAISYGAIMAGYASKGDWYVLDERHG